MPTLSLSLTWDRYAPDVQSVQSYRNSGYPVTPTLLNKKSPRPVLILYSAEFKQIDVLADDIFLAGRVFPRYDMRRNGILVPAAVELKKLFLHRCLLVQPHHERMILPGTVDICHNPVPVPADFFKQNGGTVFNVGRRPAGRRNIRLRIHRLRDADQLPLPLQGFQKLS